MTVRSLVAASILFALGCAGSNGSQAPPVSEDGSMDSQVESSISPGDGASGSDGGNESAATGVPEAGASDGNVPQGDSAPDVEAGPSQPLACSTSSVWQGIDTTACEPVGDRGCPGGQTCAIVSPTAAACVPSNLAAKDGGVGGQGFPCSTSYGCADGTICNQLGSCGIYCCTNSDCAATGLSGLHCTALAYAGDAGVVDGSASDRFGVCE